MVKLEKKKLNLNNFLFGLSSVAVWVPMGLYLDLGLDFV